jgi:hypothetical protein
MNNKAPLTRMNYLKCHLLNKKEQRQIFKNNRKLKGYNDFGDNAIRLNMSPC